MLEEMPVSTYEANWETTGVLMTAEGCVGLAPAEWKAPEQEEPETEITFDEAAD